MGRATILFGYKKGFPFSKMTTNNLISPMKFCYNTSFTLFWKEKLHLITEEMQ